MNSEETRILIVEDDAEVAEGTDRVLKQAGYVTATAGNGIAALQLLPTFQAHLVLSDCDMPGMGGMELCRTLKADPAYADVFVILISGTFTDADHHSLVLDAGADGYIARPIRNRELLARVNAFVRILQLNRSLRQQAAALRESNAAANAAQLASLNLMEDALAARARVEAANEQLRKEITARQESEAALRESEKHLRALLDGLPGVVYTFSTKRGGLYYSSRLTELLGFLPEQLQAEPRLWFNAIHPEDRPRVEHAIAEAVAGKLFCVEYRIRNSQGQWRWFEDRAFRCEVNGAETIINGHALDITDQRLAEAELRLESAALQAAANAIFITDREGRIQWANVAFTTCTGYRLPEVLGQNPRLLKSGKHNAAYFQELWKTILAGKVWHGEVINRRQDGVLYTADMTITPLQDERGEITHFISVNQDITKRKVLEAEFHQAQKMEAFGQLAGGVAHDFNNMLAVIMGNTSTLDLDLPPEERQHVIGEITKATDRAANLTRQLLAFSRRQTLQPKVVDVSELVSGMVKMLRRIIGEDIRLKTNLLTGGGLVFADPGMIEQILLNFGVNARDAMPAGGEIVISVAHLDLDETTAVGKARPGPFVRLSFRDTGSGIPAELLPRIFEPFFTTKEAGKGTGLGLATVLGIVEQHHGWITVDTAAGQGTTFHVHLPRLADQARAAAGAAEAAVPASGGSETILLVEDEAQLRTVARRTLERFGYTVLEASSGAVALEVWRKQNGAVDLVVTDMVMPGGVSGPELAERLLAEKPEQKVMFLSGYASDAARRGMKVPPGMKFLQKPFTNVKLLQEVRECLDLAPKSAG